MTKNIDKQMEQHINKGKKKITKDDAQKALDNKEEIEKIFIKAGPLEKFVNDLKLLFSVVQDYVKGEYREIPWLSIAAIVFALLYVLNPIDLIPDFIPVIGYLDDAAVVAICLALVEKDLIKYAEWKKQNA